MNKTETFLQQVKTSVVRHALLQAGNKVMVALSGGADSVALLRVLLTFNVRCVAVHCNFRLRGAESDRDEIFVRSLCARHGVELHVRAFHTRRYADGLGISIEMAARELRYKWFEQMRGEIGADCIAVAHHRDDAVETLLLNLLRGTGIYGLTGMRRRNGYVVRPLLDFSRSQILDYLKELGQDYVTDSTNLDADEATRNKIRLEVLPLLETVNPSVRDTLQATAERMADAEYLYDEAVQAAFHRVIDGRFISLSALEAEPAPRTVLYEWLSRHRFNSAQVAEIYEQRNGEPGREYQSRDWRLLRDRGGWWLRPVVEEYPCLSPVLPLEGKVRLSPDVTVCISRRPYTGDAGIPRRRTCASLDMDRLRFPLTVRFIRPGDRFVPFGMKGTRLVSDYLTDAKRSLFDKERQLVVCSGDDIVWLVGERSDDRYRVTSSTRFMFIIEVT
ncbi:MAG: tRNA lysidine(34) synthetase TilS [Clostridium sp.]|nr:tRNA lysidine(34) synthetase TilS [Clostridium sp.]